MMFRRTDMERPRQAGSSLVELALVMPFLILVGLGVTELGYGLLDLHVVTTFSREGANLISRNTSLQDAATALRQMSSRPINLDDGSSKIILSVVRRIATPGSANYNRDILYQRHEYGTLAAASRLTGGGGTFGPAPDYQAADPENDTGLRVDNLPVTLPLGGMLYVVEVFSRHVALTPLDRLGIRVPDVLYSVAYF
jgi:hypothetical protein